jgi:hypothetical protein
MQFGHDTPTFGGGATTSTISPVMLVATIIAVVLILVLPRKYLAGPFLLVTFLGSTGQQLYISGVHLYVLRIVILAGLVRLVVSSGNALRSRFGGGWNSVDTVFVLWAVFRSLMMIIQYKGKGGAIIYEVGIMWDSLGGYLLLRFLIQDTEDAIRVLKVFATIALIVGVAMINEKFRMQNIFGYLGSIPIVPGIREGSVRAQGSSAHAILAGVLGATLMPMLAWLWQSGKARLAGLLGFLGASSMVAMSGSSTPLMAYVAGLVGLLFWPFRKRMRVLRWGLVFTLIGLHLIMKAPVWFLIARLGILAGNSGYHRAMLIDQCVNHFWDWWLIGANTANWGWDMWDLSNQFVAEADTGGLLTLICFLLVITRTYARIGNARKIVEGEPQQEWFMWFLGVTLFTHLVSFFGISYFDSTKIWWSAFLAIAAAATAPILATQVTIVENSPWPMWRRQQTLKPVSVEDAEQPIVSR